VNRLKRFLKVVALAVVVALLGLALLIGEAKWETRSVAPPLPSVASILAPSSSPDLPLRLEVVNTATQVAPEFTLSHPAFLISWADGRRFLVDAGMTVEGAKAFGERLETLVSAEPVRVHGDLPSLLGPALHQITAVGLTHKHADHADGLQRLCSTRPGPLPFFQTSQQKSLGNYSTSPGDRSLDDAGCLEPTVLDGDGLIDVPGYPGLRVFAAGGHTPGSTLWIVKTADQRTYVLSGDVTNSLAELTSDTPKPWLYSLLVTPEATGRLAALRAWLARLHSAEGSDVIVSHDATAWQHAGIAAFQPPAPSAAPGATP